MKAGSPGSVTARPNASNIRGAVSGVQPLPNDQGYVWQIHVEEATPSGELPNFAASRIGETIEVYAPPDAARGLQVDDAVEAHVTFVGDEQGGQFVLSGDARKLAGQDDA